jgi:hypothetical protein
MIKRFVFGVFIIAVMSCNNDPRAKLPATGNFGTEVTEDAAKTVNDVMIITQTTTTDFPVKVTGIVEEYCKGEGCWLTLENKAGSPLLVEIENKAFILPHNINGKVAVVDGIAVQEKNAEKTEWKILAKGILIR